MDVSDEYLQRQRKRCQGILYEGRISVQCGRLLEMIDEIERGRRQPTVADGPAAMRGTMNSMTDSMIDSMIDEALEERGQAMTTDG